MKKLIKTTQFKKDFKKYKNDANKMKALLEVLQMLENETPLPDKYLLHRLVGDYKGFLECHIESDYLLIWYDETDDTIRLIRLGTHSELFR